MHTLQKGAASETAPQEKASEVWWEARGMGEWSQEKPQHGIHQGWSQYHGTYNFIHDIKLSISSRSRKYIQWYHLLSEHVSARSERHYFLQI